MARCWMMSLAVITALMMQPMAVRADDTAAPAASEKPIVERLKENPNDVKLINEYMSKSLMALFANVSSNPDAAEKQLAEMKAVLDSLQPDAADAQQLLQRAKSVIPVYSEQVALARVPLADLEAQVKAAPDDMALLRKYFRKLTTDLNGMARSQPLEAEEKLNASREFLKQHRESIKNADVVKTLEQSERGLANIERMISGAKKIAALVGKDAAPLEVESWVNGDPLADGDLKGKVVLLDFWAVWCGPCIATFPHLREWQEKYGDKGLVMIGMTRYYNFKWDEAAGRSVRSESPVTPEDEQQMLIKFAKHHELHHRFAIQSKDGKLDQYYGVSGIPHVVVIDQEGKVRMIRVGSGDKNARDISELLESLLAKK